jgi:hypothetical protein
MRAEIRLLREVAHRGPGLQEARPAIGFDQAGGNLEQGRLARAVAADEAGALAGGNGEIRARDQRRAAEGERNV